MALLKFRNAKMIFRITLLIIAAFVSASNIYSQSKFVPVITDPDDNRKTTSVTTPIKNRSFSDFVPIITNPNGSTTTTTSDGRVKRSSSSTSTNNNSNSWNTAKGPNLVGKPYGDYISRYIVTF